MTTITTAIECETMSAAAVLDALCPGGAAVAGVEVEQDFDAGTTTISFADGSSVTVDGPTVEIHPALIWRNVYANGTMMGTYSGVDEDAVLDAYARGCGYADFAGLLDSVPGSSREELDLREAVGRD